MMYASEKERDVKKEIAIINWALDNHAIEAILVWMQTEMTKEEQKSLDNTFKKFLFHNARLYWLMIDEYIEAYERSVEEAELEVGDTLKKT